MKSARLSNEVGHVTTGDIFDDLGFSHEETLEVRIKSEIWHALILHIERNAFTQTQLVERLKAHQPDVSNLLKGKISKFSITKLIQFAGRLNLSAEVSLSPARPGRLAAVTAAAGTSRRSKQHVGATA